MHGDKEQDLDESLAFMQRQFRILNDNIKVPDSLMAELTAERLEGVQNIEAEPERDKVLRFPWKRAVVLAACCVFGFVAYYAWSGTQVSEKMTPEFFMMDAGTARSAPAGSAAEDQAMEEDAAMPMPQAAGQKLVTNTGGAEGGILSDQEYAAQIEGADASSGQKRASAVELLDLQDAMNFLPWGTYLPEALPENLAYVAGWLKQDSLAASFQDAQNGRVREMFVSIETYKEAYEANRADVSNPESYNVNLYDLQAGETVPDKYRTIFYRPLFEAWEVTLPIVEARIRASATEGVYALGSIGVRYGDIVVWYDVCNLSAGEIYNVIEQTCGKAP